MKKLLRGVCGGLATVIFALVCIVPSASSANTCTRDDFASAVDEAGAAMRSYNSSAAPELSAKLRQLKARKGWTDAAYEQMAMDYLHDARIAGLDQKANDLLAKVDELGSTDENVAPDCSKLNELKATSLELLAVMKAKSKYILGKIDGELNPAKAKPSAPLVAGGETGTPLIAPSQEPAPRAAPQQRTAEKAPAPKMQERAAPAPWNTTTQSDPSHSSAGDTSRVPDTAFLERRPDASVPGYTQENLPPAGLPPDAFENPDDGYTIEEIRDASRGFFGSISANLAAVIEHTFRNWGRPTAYVLGTEGGGALLAGLRYGKGMLYLRTGGTQTVHWHGPSLGYDFGAESSRTMFLIYNMHDPSKLFRRYIGVDGSAYLVGGVGVTLLKGGPTIMAPIRTGLGLRVGANVGYVRFTSEPTWNPF
ncbi:MULTISPECIES: DUF1134 domain-containing protein [Filomicrobium]|nr:MULTISPECIES: DUF1134 domain-containing protein [Filomicrobium]